MSRARVWIILLLVASVAAGLIIGELYFRLFLRMVPPMVISSFSFSAAHAACLVYGCVLGFIMFCWGVLSIVGFRFFSGTRAASTAYPR